MNVPLHRKKLPIGIQTFAKIRDDDACYYVDKTPLILQLIDQGSHYFLSRPRRFGKSLLLDTIADLFEGRRELFQGLHAEPRWDWSRTYPVLRISFSDGVLHSHQALDQKIRELLRAQQQRHGIECHNTSISGWLAELIQRLHEQAGERVVVLIDEYDKPILDNITEPEVARQLRDGLRDLYSVLKGQDAHIQFAMLTGVSKFSKVSLFSGLNNLKDITVDARYSAICGYTDEDVDTVFAPELPGLDRDEIRRWYKGYNWTGKSVYNPFDLLLLFDCREFRPYWFETGTPTFLVDLLTERRTFAPALEQLVATEALLFQSGYLTIGSVRLAGAQTRYTLRYPNLEVSSSLTEALLGHCMPDPDMAVLFNGQVYLFEFKVVELVPEGRALQQIKDRGYADKYRARGETIHLVGVEFSKEARSVVGFEVETL